MDSRKINELREKMLGCKERCNGVLNDIGNGIIPRGMIYEASCSSGDSPLIVVVGPNPGNSSKKEKEKVKEINKINNLLKGLGFDGKPEEFFGKVNSSQSKNDSGEEYYPKIRKFIQCVMETLICDNGDMEIYWTELIKCEGKINCYIINKCYENYLKEEINLLKKLCQKRYFISIGKSSYEFLDSIPEMKEEFLIGIPHPSGRNKWYSYNDLCNKKEDLIVEVQNLLKNTNNDCRHRDLKDYFKKQGKDK